MKTRMGTVLACLGLASTLGAQGADSLIATQQRITDGIAGFTGPLDNNDRFGSSLAALDVDGDGISDVAIGADGDDDGGSSAGAVWILFLEEDGSVRAQQKISALQGGFAGNLSNDDRFGSSVAAVSDLDGNGVGDLVVGAAKDDTGGGNRGAVWVLFLNADGTVGSQTKISSAQQGIALSNDDRFGCAVTELGDLDGDGTSELAVGACKDDDGGLNRGAVWLLSLQVDGTAKYFSKISDTQGSFGGGLANQDGFGTSLAPVGDLDGNGVPDLAVGAAGDDTSGPDRGAVWILFLNADGEVEDKLRIADGQGGFLGSLANGDHFGSALGTLGDLDENGACDLVVGAEDADDGGTDRGAVWILFLTPQGDVLTHLKASQTSGGFQGALQNGDHFGCAVTSLGLDDLGAPELAVGAYGDKGQGVSAALAADQGASWMIFLRAASETVNNGNGTNPEVYRPAFEPPSLGSTWEPFVDLSTSRTDPLFHFMGGSFDRARMPMRLRAAGEVLIDFDNLFVFRTSPDGQPFEVEIPYDLNLLGLELYTQAGTVFPTGSLSMAEPVREGSDGTPLSVRLRASNIVLYNGIDIVLGF